MPCRSPRPSSRMLRSSSPSSSSRPAPGTPPAAPAMTPAALLGLRHGENLYVDRSRWDARYIPAYLRRYPFLTATLPGSDAVNVLVDEAWSGFGEVAGEPLFEADDAPAPALRRAIDFSSATSTRATRTCAFCDRLARLGVLKGMKADADLAERRGDLGRRLPHRRRGAPARLPRRHRARALAQRHADADPDAPGVLVNIRHLVNLQAARLAAAAGPTPRRYPRTANDPLAIPSSMTGTIFERTLATAEHRGRLRRCAGRAVAMLAFEAALADAERRGADTAGGGRGASSPPATARRSTSSGSSPRRARAGSAGDSAGAAAADRVAAAATPRPPRTSTAAAPART